VLVRDALGTDDARFAGDDDDPPELGEGDSLVVAAVGCEAVDGEADPVLAADY